MGQILEDISKNREFFVSYNINRMRELIRYLSTKKFNLFHTVPFLLHVNSPEFAGFVHDAQTFGISNFEETNFWKITLKSNKLTEEKIRPYLAEKNAIRAVYLMGSTGTLAQGHVSDFDYWVLIDKSINEPEALKELSSKLRLIEKWCKDKFNQEIHFFVMYPEQIRQNNYSQVSDESCGTAQKTILKEEFYRTFIVIAGQIPFWSVLKGEVSDAAYNAFFKKALEENYDYINRNFVDLGNLTNINKEECPGAILWQINKSLSNPAKSLVKSALITYYSFITENKELPCNIVKRKYSDRFLDDHLADPYTIIFEKILELLKKNRMNELSDIIKECIFLQLCGFPIVSEPDADTPKHKLVLSYVRRWKWSTAKIRHFMLYAAWAETKKRKYEQKIVNSLLDLYELVINANKKSSKLYDINMSDLKILKNRIARYYQKKPGKIPNCSTYLRAQTGKESLLISCEADQYMGDIWAVYGSYHTSKDKEQAILFNGPELLKIIGWIIKNNIYSKRKTSLYFSSAESKMLSRSAKGLFFEVVDFLSDTPHDYSLTASMPVWDKIILTLTSQASEDSNTFDHYDFIVRNTWGEMYFDSVDLSHITNEQIKSQKIAETIWTYMKQTPEFNLDFIFTHPGLNYDRDLRNMILKEIILLRDQHKHEEVDIDIEEDDDDENSLFLDLV